MSRTVLYIVFAAFAVAAAILGWQNHDADRNPLRLVFSGAGPVTEPGAVASSPRTERDHQAAGPFVRLPRA